MLQVSQTQAGNASHFLESWAGYHNSDRTKYELDSCFKEKDTTPIRLNSFSFFSRFFRENQNKLEAGFHTNMPYSGLNKSRTSRRNHSLVSPPRSNPGSPTKVTLSFFFNSYLFLAIYKIKKSYHNTCILFLLFI